MSNEQNWDDDDGGVEDDYISERAESPFEDHVQAEFERNIDDARSLEMEICNNTPEEKVNARVAFVTRHVDGWRKTTKQSRNFLHVLASDSRSTPSLRVIIARAVTRLHQLMGEQDQYKQTPLAVAINVGNKIFVAAVCQHTRPLTRQRIGKALKSECEDPAGERETCLHKAIRHSISPELINILIGFAPDAMFSMTDSRGRTPLHLAVEYERCNGPQVSVVENLVARGPSALDARLLELYGHSSVYQHHENTRRETEKKELLKEKLVQDQKHARKDGGGEKRGEKVPTKKVESVNGDNFAKGPDFTPSQAGREKATNFAVSQSTKRPGATKITSNSANLAISESTKELDATKGISNSGVSTQQLSKVQQIALDLDKEKKKSSEAIKEHLRLVYLRTRKPQEAMKFFHIQDQRDKELWFDFGPRNKANITKKEFKKQFGHLEFESVLQYVAFPQLKLDLSNDVPDERHQGRNDLVFFFEWLKSKGVKRIIKVEVDDMDMPCHSDEAIETALESLQVETLDWRKQDMCPATISKIGGDLREINLLWSGRNAVLRSWGAANGLVLTSTLESITITQIEGLESEERTKKNLDDFKEQLGQSWLTINKPTPVFIPPKSGGRGAQSQGQPAEGSQAAQIPERTVDPHKWMQCMEEFASSFRQISGISNKGSDPRLHPVTVALVDDGVDSAHPEFVNKEFHGKSFDNYNDGWKVTPYWASASGHGTLMARLVHRICPSADIYVIKLKTAKTGDTDKVQIDPLSAIQAIEHATELGVQVISMSWTTKVPDKSTVKTAFDKAIQDAHTKGVLMFCSASDQGKFADFNYPHASNANYSFRIGAAKSTGTTSEFVGNTENLSFVFPGQDVVLSDQYGDVADFAGFASHTGSSVATALASALAAVVLECVRLGVLYTDATESTLSEQSVAIKKGHLAKMTEKNAMEYALSSIGVNRQTDNRYIEVWNTFSKVARNLKNAEGLPLEKLAIVAGLARIFLRMGIDK
ncbi:hypothetical protein VE04_04991 [Pseudogymnoascus sp. 24MN13]|nr:hypothetical protein VE04_04991 [Pseudogymnoascus sp. 24MN13]